MPSWRTGPSVWLVARARLRRHWVGSVVVGLVGALAFAGVLATLAGARRTDTAYERLRKTTNAFDGRALILEPLDTNLSATATKIRLLPEIGASTVARFRVGRRADTQDWVSTTSLPALDAAASRPQIVRGRSFDIGHTNEAVLSQSTAAAMHLDVGDLLPIDFYSDRQFADVLDNYFIPPTGESVNLRIVGITRDPDDASGGRSVVVGPALLVGSDTTAGFAGVLFRLAPGVTRNRAERAIASLDLGPTRPDVIWAADTASELDGTRNAIVAGLLFAAGVLALAGVIAVTQAVARQVDQTAGDREALLAMGLTRWDRIAAATLPGGLAAVVAASGAVVGAILISPLFPTGRIDSFEPHPGFAVNLAILGAGCFGVVLVVLGAFTFASWRSERRVTGIIRSPRPPVFAPRASRFALGPAMFMGTRFALESGPRRSSVPVRTSLVGIAAGVAGVVAAITFSASLQSFLSSPAHYGQPWDLSVETLGDTTAPARLAADRDVRDAALVRSVDATVNGEATALNAVTVLKGSLAPTLESGRLPDHAGEIALGPKLLVAARVAVGDKVRVKAESTAQLRVVGTVLNIDPQDDSFGTTAFVTPAGLRARRGEAGLFNEETAIRFRPGADATAATGRLKAALPLGLTDESLPSRPAAVANVAELGALPLVLTLVLGAIATIAIAHAVVLAVRDARRHELAVLAALGLTRMQRARIVMVMAATMIALGLIIGIPIGVIIGSNVWALMAQGLRVEWAATIPVVALVAVAFAAIAITLVVTFLPARSAWRVRPAPLLRTG